MQISTAKKGIDISNHNSNVNYLNVKAAGCSYVYIKATEGKTYKDPKTEIHYNGCKRAGLKVGFYHYFKSTSEPEQQAEAFFNVIKKYKNDLIAMLDVEEDFNGMSNGVIRFFNKWKQITDIPLGIYTYSGFLNNYTAAAREYLKDVPCWIANYRANFSGVATGFFNNVIGWQNSSTASIGSFTGDTNYFDASIEINVSNASNDNIQPAAQTVADTIIKDSYMYTDTDKSNCVGCLHKGDTVQVLQYYSDLTRLKSNNSFVYVETNTLKSHSAQADNTTEKEKAFIAELTELIKKYFH